MYNLTDVGTIKDVMARHGVTFSKALGQNFLINPSVCPKMADAALFGKPCGVIEIGAGVGVLTSELAERFDKVVSFELDSKLIPVLSETLADFSNIEIINKDVLKINLHDVIDEKFAGMNVCVCANLPYYITSPIIMYLLESRLPLDNITVMVQKEAADRLCADVGSRDAGAVTAAVSYYAQKEILFDVSRGSFMPSPKVDSSVIQLKVLGKPPVTVSDEKHFLRLVRASFCQRRKTALNSISAGLNLPKEIVGEALDAAGFERNVRAESFTLNDFALLDEEIIRLS